VNLIEAIKSGRPFRRLELDVPAYKWWPSENSWVEQCEVDDWFRTISLEDLLADDWEIKRD
jgi:hypothetical protein